MNPFMRAVGTLPSGHAGRYSLKLSLNYSEVALAAGAVRMPGPVLDPAARTCAVGQAVRNSGPGARLTDSVAVT